MEEKTTNLKEWTVEDVAREIEKKFDKDIAKKFEGKIHWRNLLHSSLTLAKTFRESLILVSE